MRDAAKTETDTRGRTASGPWTLHKQSSSRVYNRSFKEKDVTSLLKLDKKRYRVVMSGGGLGVLEKSESGGSISNGLEHGHTPFTSHVDRSFFSSMPISSSTLNLLTSKEVDLVFETASRDKIKQLLRSSHWPPNHEVRGSLWRKICETVRQSRGNIYQETVTDTFGVGQTEHMMCLPQFVDPPFMHSYHLSNTGMHVVKRVVCVIGTTCPDITFSPTIYGFTSLFLHYHKEEDCYNCVYGVLRDKQASLPQTKTAFEATKYILKELARKYAKPMFQYVSKHGLQIEGILDGWVWWIFHDLPFEYLVRVMDCFLLEGCKVLYRAALAILILYHRHMIRGAEHKADSDLARSISQFCEDMPVGVDELFKVMFGLRGLSRKLLQKLMLKKEMYVKSLRRSATLPQSIPQSASCDTPMPTAAAPIEMHDLENVGSSLVTELQRCVRSRSWSLGVVPFTNLHSVIVVSQDWQEIWGWLPTRITLQRPELVYTTAEHGTSLSTFYKHVDGEEPTLLLIKTTKNEILGAYCSVDWAVRREQHKDLTYFGTGETFVFTLSPTLKKYSWVGISLGEQTRSTAHMFVAANKKMILIGGGSGVALQLDEDLYQGWTERSDTFGNPPLLEEADFKCAIVEVYGFH